MLFFKRKKKIEPTLKLEEPKPKRLILRKSKRFIVVSSSEYNETIKGLLEESDYYNESKNTLLDEWELGKHVYKYFEEYPCDLVLDESGQYKVLIYDDCVGSLKKGNTSQIKNLLNSDNYKVSAVVYGGKYKFWEEWSNGELVYDTGSCDITIKVTIDIYSSQEN